MLSLTAGVSPDAFRNLSRMDVDGTIVSPDPIAGPRGPRRSSSRMSCPHGARGSDRFMVAEFDSDLIWLRTRGGMKVPKLRGRSLCRASIPNWTVAKKRTWSRRCTAASAPPSRSANSSASAARPSTARSNANASRPKPAP
jgi:hypothetical protein